jgi:hypothetical protein
MIRFAAATVALCAALSMSLATPAAAQMQPGLWRFTQTTESGGRTRSRTTTRCVTAAQASDPAAYFHPRGAGCSLTSHSALGGRVTSSLRCTQGDVTSDITSVVSLSSPTQLTITTNVGLTTKSGRATVRMTGAGQRIGNCGSRRPQKKG